jgi:hypothetical protein
MAIYTAKQIQNHDTNQLDEVSLVVNARREWIPARPINYQFDGKWLRLKLAWGVLTGKYDALNWDGLQ